MSDLQELLAKLPTYSRPGTGKAWSECMQKVVTLLAEGYESRPGGAATREDAEGPNEPATPPPVDSLLPEGAVEFESDGMPALRMWDPDEAAEFTVRVGWSGEYQVKHAPVQHGWGVCCPEDMHLDDYDAPAYPWIRHQWSLLESKPEAKPGPEATEDGDALEMLEELRDDLAHEEDKSFLYSANIAIDGWRVERAQSQAEMEKAMERIAELEASTKSLDKERSQYRRELREFIEVLGGVNQEGALAQARELQAQLNDAQLGAFSDISREAFGIQWRALMGSDAKLTAGGKRRHAALKVLGIDEKTAWSSLLAIGDALRIRSAASDVDELQAKVDDQARAIEDLESRIPEGAEFGKEAEELRQAIENLHRETGDPELQRILDKVDARDSLTYLVNRDTEERRRLRGIIEEAEATAADALEQRDTYRAKFEGLRGAVERWRARLDAFRATVAELIDLAGNHESAFVDDNTAREEVAGENVRALDAILDLYPLDGPAPESGLVWRDAPEVLQAGTYWLEEMVCGVVLKSIRSFDSSAAVTNSVKRIAGPIDIPEPREPEELEG